MTLTNDSFPARMGTARSSPRASVEIIAELRESGGPRFKVSVLDLSRTGYRMRCLTTLRTDRSMFLTLPGLAPLESVVAWQSGDLHGCSFRVPLHDAVYEFIKTRFPGHG